MLNPQQSLGFIWAGQNDLSKHTDAFWLGDPRNQAFSDDLSKYTVSAVQKLLDLDMPNVLVANVYPKHIAPATATYLCGEGPRASGPVYTVPLRISIYGFDVD